MISGMPETEAEIEAIMTIMCIRIWSNVCHNNLITDGGVVIG